MIYSDVMTPEYCLGVLELGKATAAEQQASARHLSDFIDHEEAGAAINLAYSRVGFVYLAGPMTGIEDYNFPAFNKAAFELRAAGYSVENPADHGVKPGAEWGDYLRYDLGRLAKCETLALMPGWSTSRGARLEKSIADALGMQIMYLPHAERAAMTAPIGERDE